MPTEEENLIKVKRYRDAAEFGNTDLWDRMVIASDMTYRDQWSFADREYRKRRRKFTLTIPLIKPHIKQVVGMQVENPKELTVVANRGGSQTGAKILSKLAKHAQDDQNTRFHKTQWFEAGLAACVGFIGVFIDRNKDPKNGNLTIEKLNEFECGLDPNCVVYDFNSQQHGAKYFIWEPWIDKELIEEQYPDKAKDLKATSQASDPGFKRAFWGRLYGAVRSAFRGIAGVASHTERDLEKDKYRVTHTWYRRPKRCIMMYDNEADELSAELIIDDKKIREGKKKAKDSKKWDAFEVVRNIMHHHIRVDDIVLEEIEDEFKGIDMFPIVGFSPYFDNGWRGGMSEDMVGVQTEINYTHSTTMDLLKKLPNTGWKIRQDLGGYAAELEEKGSYDGQVLDESRAGGSIDKIEPTLIPPGLERFEQNGIRNISMIAGVLPQPGQRQRKDESGRAIIAKEAQSRTGNSPVLLNFDFSQMILNNLIVAVIRSNGVYSDAEIVEIVGADELIDAALMDDAIAEVHEIFKSQGREIPQEPPQIDAEQLQADPELAQAYVAELQEIRDMQARIEAIAAPIARDKLIEQIHDLQKGSYNTTVAASPYTPSMRSAELDQLIQITKLLIESGQPGVPGKRLVLASDVKNREEIAAEVEQLGQRRAG